MMVAILVLAGASLSFGAVIENDALRFSLDYETGNFELSAKTPGLPSCSGNFQHGVSKNQGSELTQDSLTCVSDGLVYNFAFVPDNRFLAISVFVVPDLEYNNVSLLTPEFKVDFGVELNNVRIVGCDGLTNGNTDRVGYTFLAAASERGGITAGWLTQRVASGVTLSRQVDLQVSLFGMSEYGRAVCVPRQGQEVDRFAIGLFSDPLEGLEAYGSAIARANGITLSKSIPSGYCTWYSSPYGGACDERHLAELTDFCAENLKPYGFEVIQIDDMWQDGRNRPKDFGGPRLGFLEHNDRGPYRKGGMRSAADHIIEKGMTPGLWFIPFAADPENEPAKSHPEWFVKTAAGDPYYVFWAGWCLDMTHVGAREYVSQVVRRITGEWNNKYIKIDGLWSGMATTILYPTPDYREDDLGGAVFSDTTRTNIESYRIGLQTVREAAGDDVFILGCNIAQNMRTLGASVGLVDGMRVGRDIGADWNNILPCVEMGARLYFLHNRVWYNDPDCLMLREPLTLEQARAWASWIAVSGQMNLVSEWLPGLPPERLDLVKRSMPNHGMNARPLDLFENAIPQVWLLNDEKDATRHVLAIFNWDTTSSKQVSVPLAKIGTGPFTGFEYWEGIPANPTGNVLDVTVPPASCKVIALRAAIGGPCVVSTSRHITQGIIDLTEEQWDDASRTLSGTSWVVGGDPYEIRIALPEEGNHKTVSKCNCDKGAIFVSSNEGGIAKVLIESADSAEIHWQVVF